MPSKPNYNHQRAERDRAKKAQKDLKLRERKERKAGATNDPAPDDDAQGAPEGSPQGTKE